MTGTPIAELLVDLHITRWHPRPHVSDDNPCGEANFKTSPPSTTPMRLTPVSEAHDCERLRPSR
ncbi:hypothetical protein [Nocardia gipuzkoensis]|uniref:hypothetical protein n=1 Tax=Nocardia gipuzkoensis TaxID=2749991 RepID=UPI003EDFCB2C